MRRLFYDLFIVAAVLSALVFFLVLISPAQAQQTPLCDERAEIVAVLTDEYGEVPVAMGIANNRGVIEIFTSDESWTIMLTMPNGTTCLVAAGGVWETLPTVKGLGPPA